jgi:DNA invertase Pin-like site-specific DNA recombinase
LAAVCDGQLGAVFSIEASRLARTNREWHTLLEFCGIVGVLLIDAEAVYDPRVTNDRLLLVSYAENRKQEYFNIFT